MIVTIRTGPHSQAQGPLVMDQTGLCPHCPKRRVMDPMYCRCDYMPEQATIRVGEDLITGELIERKER